MIGTIKKDRSAQLAIGAFILLTIWWILLFLSGSRTGFPNYLFGAVYGPFMSLYGGILGLKISKQWGGFKSLMGKAIIVLSLGLLAESFGQIVFSFYNIFLHVEIPYPSLADIGFFGNIPLYLFGILLLAKASGVRVSLRSFTSQVQAILFPLAMLVISYILFLQNYEFDWTQPIKIFLDFGYPFGQALYVSIAILTYSLSRKLLGGIMRSRIIFLILAFCAQYLADFNFLYQNSKQTWYNGGYGDYLYLVAYMIMALGLLQLKMTLLKLSKSGP
ncbi:hypothetical protein HYZ70_02190 [Candidatus Curtissbacteria bacterium]|nr:hypothetical protein [Candidatus Curtissbacteria bacterium]